MARRVLKRFLKIKIWQNSFKNIRDAVFKLIKSQTKTNNFIEKTPQAVRFLWNADRMLLQKFLLKIKIAARGKFSEAAGRRYFSK